ncbi:Asd/ArgC dimerization domain-containing protein, partial [Streptomyces brasiliscabiei]
HKILGHTTIAVNPTCVRVPVFFGHSEAINIETRMPYDFEHVKQLLNDAPGLESIDDEGDYPTAVSDASGNDTVYVGRLRQDISHP